ncbi:hypothetical protein [Flavobacterium sp.]|uniref:hypothetical protein n=1 Tax=Flavobacterium sp. TaxID=239 RepID=UPI003B9D1DA2
MKYLYVLLLVSSTLAAQPNPTTGYPQRIADITRMLEKDSLNDPLRWERLTLQVALLDGDWVYQPFSHYLNAETNPEKLRIKTYDKEFERIYLDYIQTSNFNFVKERDFYYQRGLYFMKTRQFTAAIADYKQLLASNISQAAWESQHFTFLALDMLFNIYVIGNDFTQALQTINVKLEEEQKRLGSRYYSYANSSYAKVKLFDKFDKREDLITYLKQLSKENFEYYFEKHQDKNTNLKGVKQLGYSHVVLLIRYLKKYESPELKKYNAIYRKLSKRNRMKENLTDNDLKTIVAKM